MEKEMALQELKRIFPKGSTVSTTVKHVSRSGMTRDIAVFGADPAHGIRNVSYLVVALEIGRLHERAVRISGCGMDMGFSIVYDMSMALYGDGYALHHQWV